MASVNADEVRNLVKLTATDIADTIVDEFIRQATAEVNTETGLTIDYSNCDEDEAATIRILAAIYALCHVTGGAAVGRNFSLGPLRVDIVQQLPVSIELLERRFGRLISRLTETAFKVVQA